jgi:anti-anti-sigma factor
MKLTVDSQDGGQVNLRLEGRVSQRDVSLNDEPIGDLLGKEAYGNKLAVDMSEVASLDSSGVNWLLICQKRARESGGQLVLHSLSPIARNVIKVLNLHTVFKVANDRLGADRMLEEDAS